MNELKILQDKLNKKIEELEEKNAELECELLLYNTERKDNLRKNMNQYECDYIDFLEMLQNDYLQNDCEFVRNQLGDFNLIEDKYINTLLSKIDRNKIKQYFNYEKYHR